MQGGQLDQTATEGVAILYSQINYRDKLNEPWKRFICIMFEDEQDTFMTMWPFIIWDGGRGQEQAKN